MRLVMVHGMRQEGQDPLALQAAWEAALHAAWATQGLTIPDYTPDMPFYGKKLDELVRAIASGSAVVAKGGEAINVSETERLMLEEYRRELGITQEQVNQEIGAEVIAKGPANWAVVQGLARVLENFPGFGEIGLNLVVQVNSYLDRTQIRTAVDNIVRPALLKGPAVVVAHSLGTIVTYRLLSELGKKATVPQLVTLGSPLGIKVVKSRLKKPLAVPAGISHWLNGTDERDYVALHSRLTDTVFCPNIENISDIHNPKEDAHSILAYLSHPEVARRIHAALTA